MESLVKISKEREFEICLYCKYAASIFKEYFVDIVRNWCMLDVNMCEHIFIKKENQKHRLDSMMSKISKFWVLNNGTLLL
ncbi:MAG: hypothetical protein ACRC5T_02640 [Cetobacterium sp.]